MQDHLYSMNKLYITLFLLLFYNAAFSHENDLWDFSKKKHEEREKTKFSTVQVLFFGTIRVYQTLLSDQQGDVCNFTPSCSHFAQRAIKKEGVIQGSLMAIDRLQRCNPWAWNHLDKYYKVKWEKARGYKLCNPP